MKRVSINGKTIADPKVLNLSPLLIYVKIETITGEFINALVHKHALNFLYQATTGSRVALYGHYNRRKQFVIDKFTVVAQAA